MQSFDLSTIAETKDGKLISTRNPEGYSQAWWFRASDIGRVLRKALADHHNVPKAAAALGVKLVEHASAMQRTETLVAKLDARHTAQAGGDLKAFNRAYRQYRISRTAAGQPAMSFTIARSRLRQALADVAAGKASPPRVRRSASKPAIGLAPAPLARQTGRVAQCRLIETDSGH
jgi:hypothetical protein